MSLYRKLAMQATGCTEEESATVCEIMREDIFHSTLDWQTRKQLTNAAKLAYQMMKEGYLVLCR
jgi:hypothetical protein